MRIDESDFHDLKDRLYILNKRVKEHMEDRKDMIKLLKLFVEIANGQSKVSWNKALLVTKKFLKDIGEF